eukprot:Nk52_evm13s237 gene=Nk52_evmTU13s237
MFKVLFLCLVLGTVLSAVSISALPNSESSVQWENVNATDFSLEALANHQSLNGWTNCGAHLDDYFKVTDIKHSEPFELGLGGTGRTLTFHISGGFSKQIPSKKFSHGKIDVLVLTDFGWLSLGECVGCHPCKDRPCKAGAIYTFTVKITPRRDLRLRGDGTGILIHVLEKQIKPLTKVLTIMACMQSKIAVVKPPPVAP